MSLITRDEIKLNDNLRLNTKCKHEAYNKNCLPCMYFFSIHYRDEINKSSLQKVIKDNMKAGLFINPDHEGLI